MKRFFNQQPVFLGSIMTADDFGYAMGNGSIWVFCILFLVLIFWLYSVIINRHNNKKSTDISQSNKRKTAIKNLQQRFAQGEIDEDEFHKRLVLLHQDLLP